MLKITTLLKNFIKTIIITTVLVLLTNSLLMASPIPITVVLDWTPNTNHTGIVVAKELGFYKKEGLAVTIVEPGKGSAEQLVAHNTAQFGISGAGALLHAVVKNIPIISIAAILATNTSGFYSLKSKNITRPKDFEGKTYGGWGSPLELANLKSVMKKDGGDPSKVKIITVGDVNLFQVRGIDFWDGYSGWTGIQAEINNIPVNFIPMVKYRGVDSYTPLIITNTYMIKQRKKLVEKFMQATALGYNYAIKNPKAAAKIFLKTYPEMNSELIVKSQIFLTDKYKGKSPYWGFQNPKIWQNYIDWEYKNKVITQKIKANLVFSDYFASNAKPSLSSNK